MATINLKTAFGQWNPTATLAGMGFSITTAKAQFPVFYAKWQGWGRTDANFLKLTWASATANEKSWAEGGCNIEFPEGVPIMVSNTIRWPFGAVTGSGIFIDPQFDTILKVADDWAGDPKNKDIFHSPSYGSDGLLAYHEGAHMDRMRFDGNRKSKYMDPSYRSTGFALWDAGEASQVGRVKADFFNNYGIELHRGTPADVLNVSAFCNGEGAVGVLGSALTSIKIGVISGDDNPTLLDVQPFAGREAGGRIVVGFMKCESATIPEGTLHPYQRHVGQCAAKLRGQFNVKIDMLSYASSHKRTGQLFWIDDRLVNGSPQASRLECWGAGFGYDLLLVDSRRGHGYKAPPDYSAWHMVYDTQSGVLRVNDVVQTPIPYKVNGGPLGVVANGGTFDYMSASPAQEITGVIVPPPQTCTWVEQAGAWGTCQPNGTQARTVTYVPSIAGCMPTTAKPADRIETQACTPPPTGAVLSPVLNNWNNANPSASPTPVNWTACRSIVLTGIARTGTAADRMLVARADGRGIWVRSDGGVNINTSGSDVLIAPAGTVTSTAKTVTLTLPGAETFNRFGSHYPGAAFLGTITKVEAKA